MQVTRQEVSEWLNHPVTKAHKAFLVELVSDLSDPAVLLSDAKTSVDSNEAGMRSIARANKIDGLLEAYESYDLVTALGGEAPEVEND